MKTKKINKVGTTILFTLAPATALGVVAGALIASIPQGGKVTEEERRTVDSANTLLANTHFDTMYQMMVYLRLNNIDLEAKEASGTNQYVWDIDSNVIFVMDSDGNIAYGPADYTLNSDTSRIWKMVELNVNSNSTEAFVQQSAYGQFIRTIDGAIPAATVNFSSSIDIGFNENVSLLYQKPESTDKVPMVVTNTSDLEINGSLTDVDHYGHAKSVTVTELGNGKSYNEYGTVDGSIILKTNASYVGQPGSEVVDIIIEDDTASVTLHKDDTTEEYAKVGSISKTTGVTKEISELVTKDPTYTKEESPKEEKRPVDPSKSSRYAGGLGTIGSPYIISTPQQLLNCSDDVSGTDATALTESSTLHFVLGADIDMTGQTFSPIGTKDKPFYGTFDGQDFTISNLTITANSDYVGLFGCSRGPMNELYSMDLKGAKGEAYDNIWDGENKRVKTENFDESKYQTVIKNVYIDNISVNATGKSYVGGIVGKSENTYVYNCHVLTGTISAKSNMGGIVGAASGSIINLCSTSSAELKQAENELKINSSQYNVGGIIGHPARAYDDGSGSRGSAILNCANYATVQCTSSTSNPNAGPSVSGIAGNTTNNNKQYYPTIIDNCGNYGNITAISDGNNEYTFANPSGISSEAQGIYILSNSENKGNITNSNGSSLYISGLICHGAPIVYNCSNFGDVTGKGDQVAGICSADYNEGNWESQFIDIHNYGTVSTSKTGGKASDYFVTANNKTLTGTFADIDALLAQMTGATTVVLKNVVVTNIDKPLTIPDGITSFISDNDVNHPICETIKLGNVTNISIDVPGSNLLIDSDHTSHNVYVYSKGSNITVTENGKIGALISGGENSNIVNNGTVRTIGLYFRGTQATNNGTVSNVEFDAASRGKENGIANKEFTNYGSVSSTNNHTFYTQSLIAVNPTINNYGSILSSPTISATYLFLWYSPGNFTLNSYAGSSCKTTVEIWGGIIAMKDIATFNINYQDGATLYQGSVIKPWTELATSNVIVTKID